MDSDLEKRARAVQETEKCEVLGVSGEYCVDSAVHAGFFFSDYAAAVVLSLIRRPLVVGPGVSY